MKRTRNLTTRLVAIAVVAMGSTGLLPAQGPPMDMSGLVNQNVAFDQMMQQQAADFATQWYNDAQAYRARTGYTGPINSGFNASTLNAANLATSTAFYDYNQSWWNNQQTINQSMNNYSQAYRGYADYTGLGGQTYDLPYGHDYYQDTGGYVYQAQPGVIVALTGPLPMKLAGQQKPEFFLLRRSL